MIGLVTELARQQQAEAVKSSTGAHAMAEGVAEHHRERREELGKPAQERDHLVDDDVEEKSRHATSGRFAEPHTAPLPPEQRGYVDAGHASQSPANAPGVHAAVRPGVASVTGGPLAESIQAHGVARTALNYGPVTHQAPAGLAELSTASGAALGSSLAPGQASVQSLDYRAGVSPVAVQQSPVRPGFHTAPIGVRS